MFHSRVLGFVRKCSMHVPSCFPGASLSCSSCGWPAFGCRLLHQVKQTKLNGHNYSCWLRTDKRFPPVCSTLNNNLHLLPHLWLLREDVHPSQKILGPGGFPPCLRPLRNEVTRQKVDWAPTVCMWVRVCAHCLTVPLCAAAYTTIKDNRGSVRRHSGHVWGGLLGHSGTVRSKGPSPKNSPLTKQPFRAKKRKAWVPLARSFYTPTPGNAAASVLSMRGRACSVMWGRCTTAGGNCACASSRRSNSTSPKVRWKRCCLQRELCHQEFCNRCVNITFICSYMQQHRFFFLIKSTFMLPW